MISLPTASIDLKLLQVTEECITCLKIAPKLIILGKEGPLLFKNLQYHLQLKGRLEVNAFIFLKNLSSYSPSEGFLLKAKDSLYLFQCRTKCPLPIVFTGLIQMRWRGLDIMKLMLHCSGYNSAVGLWYFDLQRAFTPRFPMLSVIRSHTLHGTSIVVPLQYRKLLF